MSGCSIRHLPRIIHGQNPSTIIPTYPTNVSTNAQPPPEEKMVRVSSPHGMTKMWISSVEVEGCRGGELRIVTRRDPRPHEPIVVTIFDGKIPLAMGNFLFVRKPRYVTLIVFIIV